MQASLLKAASSSQGPETPSSAGSGAASLVDHQPISQQEREEDRAQARLAAGAAPRMAARRPRDQGWGRPCWTGLEVPGVSVHLGERWRDPRPSGGARGCMRQGRGGGTPARLEVRGAACVRGGATHSSTSRLNCFCRLPRNSPIICRLRPLRCSRKWATPTGVSGTKPRSMRYWTPFSGFLADERQAQLGASAPARLRLHGTWSFPSLSPPPGAPGLSRPRAQPGPVRGAHSGPTKHALAARGQAGWLAPRGPPRQLSPHTAPAAQAPDVSRVASQGQDHPCGTGVLTRAAPGIWCTAGEHLRDYDKPPRHQRTRRPRAGSRCGQGPRQ